MRETKVKEEVKLKSQKAITLIALVITIIVLLILAAVSIATLTGENGILTRANDAKLETRGASVEEARDLWKASKEADKQTGTTTAQTLEELVNDLVAQKLLTEDEKDQILGNETKGIEAQYKVTIGSRTIEFGTTLGDVYTDEMIGQKMSYSANGQTEWIVFGKDKSGNILLTTKNPIADGFTLNGTAQAWLSYENDLNTVCSGYGGTIKGKAVTSRSITLEDINYVTGFTEPNFKTYTFGTENDFASRQVDYYYPDALGSSKTDYPYFVKAGETISDKTVASKDFPCNAYYYYKNGEEYKVSWEGTDWGEATTTLSKADNMKYVIGEDGTNAYVVASRSVGVLSSNAFFSVAFVENGIVFYDYYLCNSYSSSALDNGNSVSVPVRPVVVLPSSIQVEEDASGLYDLAE